MNVKKLLLTITLLLYSFSAYADTYQLDPAHSSVGFSVKHMVISNVKGEFTKYSTTFELDKNDNIKSVSVEIDASSLYTRNPKRDKHLKSPDFFDVEKFPKLTFTYKKTISKNGSAYKILGDLVIHGVSKEVTLEGEMLGKIKDPWGKFRVGFTGSATINRKDFGLVWNKILETGGLLVGDVVKISLEGEGILQK